MWRVLVCCFVVISVVNAQSHTLSVDGVERSYLLHVPPDYDPQIPLPLLLVLHGRGGNGESMEELSGFSPLADEENFMVVYPNGLDKQWNFVQDPPGYTRMRQDDVKFLLTLIDEISSMYAVDETRIFVTGFSNGGFMTQRLACAAPERFAAFASVGGAGFGGLAELCQRSVPLSLLLMHGTEDTIVPWEGNTRRRLDPVLETFAFWSMYGACHGDITALPLPQQDDKTSVTLMFADCTEGNEVVLYKIEGGGHNWPGVEGILAPRVAGNVTMDIEASRVIWDFFSRHQKQ
ncbi:MAG: extracellular catalytic domain type 1 short-chain-length polyhydroxyalkanoate depolymerase [Trueperaceae bacterium]